MCICPTLLASERACSLFLLVECQLLMAAFLFCGLWPQVHYWDSQLDELWLLDVADCWIQTAHPSWVQASSICVTLHSCCMEFSTESVPLVALQP